MSLSAARFWCLCACFLFSGFCGLVYQVGWTQQLSLLFGTAELTSVIILVSFMGGLGLGAFCSEVWLVRFKNPIRLYALFEVALGLWALGMPSFMQASGVLQKSLFLGRMQPDALPLSLFLVAMGAALLVLPTALMGATLPLLLRGCVQSTKDMNRLPLLYGLNTLGAGLGAFFTGWYFLPVWGQSFTLKGAMVLNFCVGLMGWFLARPVSLDLPKFKTFRSPGRVVFSAFLCGFICFGHEVIWTRLLAFILGNSLSAYAMVLTVFLGGMAVGALILQRFFPTDDRAKNWLPWLFAGLFLVSFLGFAGVDFLPDLAKWTRRWPGWMSGLMLASVCLGLPALGFGMGFPLLIRATRVAHDALAETSGRLLWVNTIGCILGALFAGLVLLPAFGFGHTLWVLLFFQWMLWLLWSRRPIWIWLIPLVFFMVPEPRALLMFSPVFHHKIPGEFVAYHAGKFSTVVTVDQGDAFVLYSNGLPESTAPKPGQVPGLFRGMYWMTLLPFALREAPQNLLLIGYGCGTNLHVLPDQLERADVVELEPKMLEANRSLPRQAHDPLSDSRVHFYFQDARSVLRLVEEPYDIILSQPSHPWTLGASHLYTAEFYQNVQAALSADGLFVQWMGLNWLDATSWPRLVATFTAVFPYTAVFVPPPGGSILVVGGNRPVDWQVLPSQAGANLQQLWQTLGVWHDQDLQLSLVLDAEQCLQIAQGFEPNRDEHNLFQTEAPRFALGNVGFWSSVKTSLDLGSAYANQTCWIQYGATRPCEASDLLEPEVIFNGQKAVETGDPVWFAFLEKDLLAIQAGEPFFDQAQWILAAGPITPERIVWIDRAITRQPFSVSLWLSRMQWAMQIEQPDVFFFSLFKLPQYCDLRVLTTAEKTQLETILDAQPWPEDSRWANWHRQFDRAMVRR